MHSGYKVRACRENVRDFCSKLPALPLIPKQSGKPYLQGSAALCWSSGVSAAEAGGCKINFEKRNFLLSSVIGALCFFHFFSLIRHLAEQTLMTCGRHRLLSAECSYPWPHWYREHRLSRTFPGLCVLSKKEKVLLICHF